MMIKIMIMVITESSILYYFRGKQIRKVPWK